MAVAVRKNVEWDRGWKLNSGSSPKTRAYSTNADRIGKGSPYHPFTLHFTLFSDSYNTQLQLHSPSILAYLASYQNDFPGTKPLLCNHMLLYNLSRPDMTFAVDWPLNNNYLSIYV